MLDKCNLCDEPAAHWRHDSPDQCAGKGAPDARCLAPLDHHNFMQKECASHERIELNRGRTFRNVWECIDCGADVDIETIVHLTGERATVEYHDD